jgi:hypothetical protein
MFYFDYWLSGYVKGLVGLVYSCRQVKIGCKISMKNVSTKRDLL